MKDERRRTVFGTPINPDMGEGRYQDTLRRFHGRIAGGLKFKAFDSTFTGDKYTSAEWGLCSCEDAAAYPDANDHTFPDAFVEHKRLTPRSPPKGATCPFDRGRFKPDALNPGNQGCFYRCMLFNPVKGQLPLAEKEKRPPTREEALGLYADLIAMRETLFGKKTTADDNEAHWEPR